MVRQSVKGKIRERPEGQAPPRVSKGAKCFKGKPLKN